MVSDREPSHLPGNQGHAANEPRLEDELSRHSEENRGIEVSLQSEDIEEYIEIVMEEKEKMAKRK